MAEHGTDEAAAAFSAEINPEPTRQPARNDRGQFETSAKPVERMFEPRQVEGDELGDTRDGGADRTPRRTAGKGDGDGREELPDGLEVDETSPDSEQGGEGDDERPDGEGEPDGESDEGAGQEGEHYEVTVDGETKNVSLKEALEGYIRTETFHQRMNKVNEAANLISAEVGKNAQLRDYWIKRNQDLEHEFSTLIPKEPNWDEEFAKNPQAAHALQKQYETVKGKLAEFRQQREQEEQKRSQEAAQHNKQFAESEYAKFITNNKIPDRPTLEKEVASMRKTALAAGFTEQDIAAVYDSRMLTILRKASKYDRIVAAKPRAVIPGRGKTLAPGSGNGGGSQAPRRTDRKGIDAAQQRLAKSGRLEDAEDFFKTILR